MLSLIKYDEQETTILMGRGVPISRLVPVSSFQTDFLERYGPSDPEECFLTGL